MLSRWLHLQILRGHGTQVTVVRHHCIIAFFSEFTVFVLVCQVGDLMRSVTVLLYKSDQQSLEEVTLARLVYAYVMCVWCHVYVCFADCS